MGKMSWRDYSGWTKAVLVAALFAGAALIILASTGRMSLQLWLVLEAPLVVVLPALGWRDYLRKFGIWPRPNTDRLRQYRDPRWIAVLLLAAAAGGILGLLS